MVTTRRGRLSAHANGESSSSGDQDIPAHALHRPEPTTGASSHGAAKKKRDASATFSAPAQKRPRLQSKVRDSIDVAGPDGDLAAAIDMTNAQSRLRASHARPIVTIEIPLRSSRMWFRDEGGPVPSVAPEDQSVQRSDRRPRAKRITRHINSLEVIGEVATPGLQRAKHVKREEATPTGAESPGQPMGSPELQSSTVKAWLARRPVDVYDLPGGDEESEPPTPQTTRRLTTINGLGHLSRADKSGLASIREGVQQRPAPLCRPADQAEVPVPACRRPSTTADEEDHESVGDGNEVGEAEEIPEPGESGDEEWNETQHSESDSELDEHATAVDRHYVHSNQKPIILIRPYTQRTMTVPSHHLNEMLRIMAKDGWTAAGRRWEADRLSDSFMFEHREESPALTQPGKDCLKSLSHLKDSVGDVPSALDLAQQYRFLDEKHQVVDDALREVEKAIDSICLNGGFAFADGSSRRIKTDSRLRESLARDLSSYLIPMTVIVLRSAFSFGIKESGAEYRESLPEEGTFTNLTVQYMTWITLWLERLEMVLSKLSQDADNDDDDDGFRDSDSLQRANEQSPKQHRRKFGVMVRKWKEQLKQALDHFNEQADRDQDRWFKKQRDMDIKEAHRKAGAEEVAERQKRWNAFALSLERMASQPGPLAEKWQAHWGLTTPPASSSGGISSGGASSASTGRSNLGFVTASESRSLSSSSSGQPPPLPAQRQASSTSTTRPAAPRARPASPPELDYPPWPEDETEWFLKELTRPDRQGAFLEICAETLSRPLHEVRQEMERLKRAGRYRSPGR